MQETASGNGLESSGAGIAPDDYRGPVETRDAWLRTAVHDLCQPLMALECLLYVNREPVEDEPMESSVLRRVMDEGLVECARMLVLVRGMQERLAEGVKAPGRRGVRRNAQTP